MATAPATVAEDVSVAHEIADALRHSFVYGLGNILAKAVGFAMLPFYTHYLSPRDYGIWEILEVTMSLLAVILQAGISAAVLRFYGNADSELGRRQVVSSAFVFVITTGCVTLLTAAAFAGPLSRFLFGGDTPSTYLLLSLISFATAYMNVPAIAFLRAQESSAKVVTAGTAALVVQLTLNVVFLAILKLGLVGVLISGIIANGGQLVVLGGMTLRKVGLRPNARLLRSMLKFGTPLILSGLSMFAVNYSDRMFLQRFASLETVGIYAIGYKFAFMINFLLMQPFFQMWPPRMFTVHRRPDSVRIFHEVFLLFSVTVIWAGLGLTLFSPEIVRVMVDARYAGAEAVIPIVVLAYVIWAMGDYLQLLLLLSPQTAIIGWISIIGSLVTFAANYVLIGRFGIIGAAWATLFGFGFISVVSYHFSRRVVRIDSSVARALKALGVAILLYLSIRQLPAVRMWLMLSAKASAFIVFPMILWLSALFTRNEIATLSSLKRRLARVFSPARPLLGGE